MPEIVKIIDETLTVPGTDAVFTEGTALGGGKPYLVVEVARTDESADPLDSFILQVQAIREGEWKDYIIAWGTATSTLIFSSDDLDILSEGDTGTLFIHIGPMNAIRWGASKGANASTDAIITIRGHASTTG